MLAIGIIKDDVAMKSFPSAQNGLNKCLFRENSQDQMIHEGRGMTEEDSFADLIREKDVVRAVLNVDQSKFEVYAPRTTRKYVARP